MPSLSIPLVGFDASGGTRVITQVANCLVANGWDVEIVVPSYKATASFPLDKRIVLKVVPISGRWQMFRYLLWLAFNATQGADVCMATYYLTPYPIFFANLLRGWRSHLVYFIQHYEPLSQVQTKSAPRLIKRMLYLFACSTYWLPFRQVAVSSWIKDQIGRQSIMVLPNGIDTSIFYADNQPASATVIGAVGRLGPTKGFPIFLEAIQPLLGQVPIHVLSDASVLAPDGVKHIQPTDPASVGVFYRACTLFVFTSTLEGFGLPPLEAMACGAAVITTDCGGVRQYATEENSIIVPVDDAPAIQSAIERLLADPDLVARLRANGLATAARFSLDHTCQAYREFFAGVVQ
ncbi:MAG: glycosyltransferase family 4 protein [Anaerolineales bacterium]|nr:glycosyltransferase family 4 protein [Anaerolineales bacterium]